jgi:hypothetical protein
LERSLSAVSAPASLISFTPVPRRRAVRLGPLFLYYCNVADIVESPRADAPSLRRVMCCLLSRPGAADADPERRANLLGKGGGRGGCFSFFFGGKSKEPRPRADGRSRSSRDGTGKRSRSLTMPPSTKSTGHQHVLIRHAYSYAVYPPYFLPRYFVRVGFLPMLFVLKCQDESLLRLEINKLVETSIRLRHHYIPVPWPDDDSTSELKTPT